MTTIAYKDGVIAYDSRATVGQAIIDDEFNKHEFIDGVDYFYAGKASDISRFALSYKAQKADKIDALVFAVDDGILYRVVSDDEFDKLKLDLNKHWAIGSGEDHALTAMDMGASAKEAIEMAMKRDCGTGGRVRTYKVK